MSALFAALGPALRLAAEAVLRLFLDRARDRAENSKADPALRERLARRIRAAGRRGALLLLAGALLGLGAGGCFTRTVYVPDGEPVRLRETVRRAKVWVRDREGAWTAGQLDLPEGWYALSDNDAERKEE